MIRLAAFALGLACALATVPVVAADLDDDYRGEEFRELVIANNAPPPAQLSGAHRPGLATSRIKDIAQLQSARDNQLVGYGLVIGLQGSGDSLRN